MTVLVRHSDRTTLAVLDRLTVPATRAEIAEHADDDEVDVATVGRALSRLRSLGLVDGDLTVSPATWWITEAGTAAAVAR